MADNIHPVVELLAARMESHPEEFGPNGDGRWGTWLKQMEPLLTEEEKLMLRSPEMQDIHEEVLDELLNGEQRRAEQARRKEEEMQRLLAQAQQQASNTAQNMTGMALVQRQYQNDLLQQYQNAGLNIQQDLGTSLLGGIKKTLGLK